MIARATLALMLAYPTATAILACPHGAMATVRNPAAAIPPPGGREPGNREAKREASKRVASARRSRHLFAARHPRRESSIVGATVDDGLAYDTPRGPDGRPVALALGAHPATGAARPEQIGMASWYGGRRWQGHLTSSGQRYDEMALTAAHATLPLGSQVRVRLVDSDREVIVTITDRPGTRRRIIDLSRAAAAALGILSRGVAEVAVAPL